MGRASEAKGNQWWQDNFDDQTKAAAAMLGSDAVKTYFGDAISSDADFIANIYKNTLNKSADGSDGTTPDAAGINYWIGRLDGSTGSQLTRAEMIVKFIEVARASDTVSGTQFSNRVSVSDYAAENLLEAPEGYKELLSFHNSGDKGLVVTDTATSVDFADGLIDALSGGSTVDGFTLTENTDIESASVFNAPMVYTPNGSDRILSLQDEDTLTGEGDNATLNATLGNINADEGTTATVTPTLKNIKNINIDWTGNTKTLDLRYADSTESIHLNKITSDAGDITVDNISTNVTDLKVAHSADQETDVTFAYRKGILKGTDDKLDLTLDNVIAGDIVQGSTANSTEGFETLNIKASNGVDLQSIKINELQNVKITGSDDLSIVSLTPTAPIRNDAPEYNNLNQDSGLFSANSAGIKMIDASEFKDDITLDISSAMGKKIDPNDSGKAFYGEVKGGEGNDKFYTSSAVAGNDAIDKAHNIIDGGAGENTLVSTVGGITNDAEIKNIQTLELREQNTNTATFGADGIWGTSDDINGTTVDMDAFDDKLVKIFMRDEDAGATKFDLNDVTKTQAENGLTLAHATSATAGMGATGNTVVDVSLADAKGSDDTVALTIVNDKNQGNLFNYTLVASGKDSDQINPTTDANRSSLTKYDGDAVENITIHDKDTETNVLTLTNIYDHSGTITLDGGVAGDTFTVAGTINAKTIDASGQMSNVHIAVGDTLGTISPIAQAVKLGTGDDVLTFVGTDELGAGDTLVDAGGNDTVRATFSKDAALDLKGIENLHVSATENITLDMAKADVSNLVLLSNTATDNTTGSQEVDNNGVVEMNEPTAGNPNNIITLKNTKLTELNFFADADSTDQKGPTATPPEPFIDDSFQHRFNGVTLANNTGDTLKVNINTSLDANQLTSTGGGAKDNGTTPAYDIGKIEAHGIKSMDIIVGNESTTAEVTTQIHNIYAKNMDTLTATTTGNLNLGTVSGSALNNSLKTFDMMAVKGKVTADVISLGDNAVVKLANGSHDFSALGSSGKDIHITSGNGNSKIEGTGQDDTIVTGSGNDKVYGDRGDNVISVGAGNDAVTAKDGNDTVDFGTGFGIYADNYGTQQDGTQATNTVSLKSGIVATYIDVKGDSEIKDLNGNVVSLGDFNSNLNVNNVIATGTADDVIQVLAVGEGSTLTVSWTGDTLNTNNAVLDGARADLDTIAGTSNVSSNNLVIQTTAGAHTFDGGAGNDVYITTTNAVTDTVTFNGGSGNDAVVGSMGADEITGGTGADMIALQNRAISYDAQRDTVKIADGESTASGYDIISGFDTTATTGDTLDLASTTIATNVVADITAAGSISSYTVLADGVVTFQDSLGKTHNVGTSSDSFKPGTANAGEFSLKDALAFLGSNITNGETVLFQYDQDGDGDIDTQDASFVFQGGASDTVVMLTHDPINGTTFTGISDTDVAGSIFIS
jgi:hypothetical protein